MTLGSSCALTANSGLKAVATRVRAPVRLPVPAGPSPSPAGATPSPTRSDGRVAQPVTVATASSNPTWCMGDPSTETTGNSGEPPLCEVGDPRPFRAAALYTSTKRAAAWVCECSRTTYERAASASREPNCGSPAKRMMAAASASGSDAGTSNPVRPSSIISARPPTAPAITGRPQAMASRAESEVASSTFSECTDGTKTMSARRYSCPTASRLWPPRRRTSRSSPCSRTTRSIACLSPPSPAYNNRNRAR